MAVDAANAAQAVRNRVSVEKVSRYGPIIGLVGLYVIFAVASDRFLTYNNQLNILRQSAIIGILAIGVTFVIICAEIDLSIAEMLEFSALLIAAPRPGISSQELPLFVAVLAGFGAAGVLGGISGYVTSRFEVPSFMTTLAMLFLADGLGQMVSR